MSGAMDVQDFLATQVVAMEARRRDLNAIREAMTEGECHPDCIEFVVGKLTAVFDQHSATASHDASPQEVAQLFRSVMNDLQLALVESLAENWNHRRGAAA